MLRSEHFDEDQRHRYTLRREWSGAPTMTFVMLNPTTNDEHVDDSTTCRCMWFARREGYGALLIVNLYSFICPRLSHLWDAAEAGWDLDGPNHLLIRDSLLEQAARHELPVVAAWGPNRGPLHDERVEHIRRLTPLWCLGTTKSGAPRHPLYLSAATPLVPWGTS